MILINKPEHKKSNRCWIWAILIVQTIILSINSSVHSPVMDEVGHLAAGLYSWRTGRFDVYRVNPPLVRLVASLPIAMLDPEEDWSSYRPGTPERLEWSLGVDLARANGPFVYWYYVYGRLACIPFVLLGTWFCWLWGRDLFDESAGLCAAALWAFDPNILGWGSTFTPDVAMASLGVMAHYWFWQWLRKPNLKRACLAATGLALALLSKTTWILLLGLWPLLYLLWVVLCDRSNPFDNSKFRSRSAGQLLFILVGGLYGLNLGYGFEGSGGRLGTPTFISHMFAGSDSMTDRGPGGNRFRGTFLEHLTLPVPENYVSGIDLQKYDFEVKKWSYLCGEYRFGGWWYYYLVAVGLKVPLGTLLLGVIACCCFLCGRRETWKDELVLCLPGLAIFLIVSSETGFNRYLRYVFGCFPFAAIWISRVASAWNQRSASWQRLTYGLLIWTFISSLSTLPHSLSYFNELGGGSSNGHRYLIDANVDWGQDLFRLRDWQRNHPEATPMIVELHGLVAASECGVRTETPIERQLRANLKIAKQHTNALSGTYSLPGWFAISVHRLHDQDRRLEFFLKQLQPVARIGYSIQIFHLSIEDAQRLRRQQGLPTLITD